LFEPAPEVSVIVAAGITVIKLVFISVSDVVLLLAVKITA
jgi:hypothetical protein